MGAAISTFSGTREELVSHESRYGDLTVRRGSCEPNVNECYWDYVRRLIATRRMFPPGIGEIVASYLDYTHHQQLELAQYIPADARMNTRILVGGSIIDGYYIESPHVVINVPWFGCNAFVVSGLANGIRKRLWICAPVMVCEIDRWVRLPDLEIPLVTNPCVDAEYKVEQTLVVCNERLYAICKVNASAVVLAEEPVRRVTDASDRGMDRAGRSQQLQRKWQKVAELRTLNKLWSHRQRRTVRFANMVIRISNNRTVAEYVGKSDRYLVLPESADMFTEFTSLWHICCDHVNHRLFLYGTSRPDPPLKSRHVFWTATFADVDVFVPTFVAIRRMQRVSGPPDQFAIPRSRIQPNAAIEVFDGRLLFRSNEGSHPFAMTWDPDTDQWHDALSCLVPIKYESCEFALVL
jgi:hypothetical protein